MAKDIDQFRQAMDQGHSAAWDQNWEKAAEFYRDALRASEDNPQALTSLGLALIELGQLQEALACYQKSAQLEPEDPLSFEKIGQLCEMTKSPQVAVRAFLRAADLYIKDKDAHKAIENWEHIIRLEPNNLAANMRLGVIYEKLGNKKRAVKAYLASASELQSRGNPEKARQMIEQALKIMPNNQDAIHFLGLLSDYKPLPKETKPPGISTPKAAARDADKQSRSIKQVEDDPIQEAVKTAVAVLASLVFETDQNTFIHSSQRDFQALVSGAADGKGQLKNLSGVKQHISQAIDFQKHEKYGAAGTELQKAVDMGLDHPAAFFDLGFLYSQAGSLDKALSNLQNAGRNADFSLGAHLFIGNLLKENERYGEAAIEYLHALKLADIEISPEDQTPGLQQWYELLIDTSMKKQDPALQRQSCDNIPSMLDRQDWRVALQRVRQQMPGNHEGGTLIPLGELISQVESSEIIESIASINDLADRGLYQSAMEEALYALQLAPTYLPMHALIGDLLEKTSDHEGAVSKFQTISRAYEIRGEMSQSVAYAHKIVELAPGDLNARSQLIDKLIAAGQMNDAIDEISQLAEFHYALADLNSSREAYLRAFKTAQRAGSNFQIKVGLLKKIADIHLQAMEWRKAIEIYEEIRSMQPDNAGACDQIVRLNLRLGKETQALAELDIYIRFMKSNDRASELASLIEALLKDYPENIPIKRRLVDTYRLTGQTSEAVAQLDGIGEMLLQSGDHTGAIQTVETIISLTPPNISEYQDLLEKLRKEIS